MNVEPSQITNQTKQIVLRNSFSQFCVVHIKCGKLVPLMPEVQYMTLQPGKSCKIDLRERQNSDGNTTLGSAISHADSGMRSSLVVCFCTSSQRPSNEQQLLAAKRRDVRHILVPFVQSPIDDAAASVGRPAIVDERPQDLELTGRKDMQKAMSGTIDQLDGVVGQSVDGFRVLTGANNDNAAAVSKPPGNDVGLTETSEGRSQPQKIKNNDFQSEENLNRVSESTREVTKGASTDPSSVPDETLRLFSERPGATIRAESPSRPQVTASDPLQGAMSSSTSVFDQISEIHPDDRTATYQNSPLQQNQFPSVTMHDLRAAIANEVPIADSECLPYDSNSKYLQNEVVNNNHNKINYELFEKKVSEEEKIKQSSPSYSKESESSHFSDQNNECVKNQLKDNSDSISDELLGDVAEEQQSDVFEEMFRNVQVEEKKQNEEKITSEITSSSILGDRSFSGAIQEYKEKQMSIDQQLLEVQSQLDVEIQRLRLYEKKTERMQGQIRNIRFVYIVLLIGLIIKNAIFKK